MKWSLYSLFLHAIIVVSIFFWPKFEPKSLSIVIINSIPQNHFDQIVNTSKGKQVKTNNKKYLSDKTNDTDKNQIARGSPKSDNKSTSILKKGSYKAEDKKGQGISANDDYIAGATIGPMTILNTQEFKYFNYYQRLKERVSNIWKPYIRSEILKLNQQKKLTWGIHKTSLIVRLNEHGEVLNISIAESSGYIEFDRVAILTFKEGSPFAGPPKELIKDGHFTLYWYFLVIAEESGIIEFKGNYVK